MSGFGFRSILSDFGFRPSDFYLGRCFGPRDLKTSLDKLRKFLLTFLQKIILHFLKTLLKGTLIGFPVGSYFLFFESVPLGRFYSSRPSSRIHHELVLE